MQGGPAGKRDLRVQSSIGRLTLQGIRALELAETSERIAIGGRDRAQTSQGIGFATGISQLLTELECFSERAARLVPLAQILVRLPEVVPGHGLLAQHPGAALRIECLLVHVLRLGVITHAVVQDRDPVERGERVSRHLDALVQRLRMAQVSEAGCVLALQPEQIAAREECSGEHLRVTRSARDLDCRLIEREGGWPVLSPTVSRNSPWQVLTPAASAVLCARVSSSVMSAICFSAADSDSRSEK